MSTAEMTRSGSSGSRASGSGAADELKADADRLKDTAKERASEEADKRKSQAARAAHSTSDALDKAAGEIESDSDAPNWLGSAFREAAKTIDRLAGEVEGRSPERMARDLSRFAREHPTSFLAASAAAGFAAARFFRAGADFRQDSEDGATRSSGEWSESPPRGRFENATLRAEQQRGQSAGGMTR